MSTKKVCATRPTASHPLVYNTSEMRKLVRDKNPGKYSAKQLEGLTKYELCQLAGEKWYGSPGKKSDKFHKIYSTKDLADMVSQLSELLPKKNVEFIRKFGLEEHPAIKLEKTLKKHYTRAHDVTLEKMMFSFTVNNEHSDFSRVGYLEFCRNKTFKVYLRTDGNTEAEIDLEPETIKPEGVLVYEQKYRRLFQIIYGGSTIGFLAEIATNKYVYIGGAHYFYEFKTTEPIKSIHVDNYDDYDIYGITENYVYHLSNPDNTPVVDKDWRRRINDRNTVYYPRRAEKIKLVFDEEYGEFYPENNVWNPVKRRDLAPDAILKIETGDDNYDDKMMRKLHDKYGVQYCLATLNILT